MASPNSEEVEDSGVMGELISMMIKKALKGEDPTKVPLPVRIFEKRSLLQRLASWWTPQMLVPSDSVIENFKATIAFAISTLRHTVNQKKPFNPILGETYQATYEDGSKFFAEQTSNHPPITQYLVDAKDFQFSGSYHFLLSFKGNYMQMRNDGTNKMHFSKTGQKITFNYPYTKVSGILFGSKTVTIEGSMVFEDEANALKAQIFFSKQTFTGVFYRRDPTKAAGAPSKVSQIKDMAQELVRIEGNWTQALHIGGEEYWNVAKSAQALSLPVASPLPSDSRYREDLVWLKRGNVEYAQGWKEVLEEQQRHNRKLRQPS